MNNLKQTNLNEFLLNNNQNSKQLLKNSKNKNIINSNGELIPLNNESFSKQYNKTNKKNSIIDNKKINLINENNLNVDTKTKRKANDKLIMKKKNDYIISLKMNEHYYTNQNLLQTDIDKLMLNIKSYKNNNELSSIAQIKSNSPSIIKKTKMYLSLNDKKLNKSTINVQKLNNSNNNFFNNKNSKNEIQTKNIIFSNHNSIESISNKLKNEFNLLPKLELNNTKMNNNYLQKMENYYLLNNKNQNNTENCNFVNSLMPLKNSSNQQQKQSKIFNKKESSADLSTVINTNLNKVNFL